MTAPILREEYYELSTKIEEIKDGKYHLWVEKEYQYDDVWAARNAYERFFRKNEERKGMHFFDRWINMSGDEECMMVKMVYVYSFDTIKEAKLAEEMHQKQWQGVFAPSPWEDNGRGSLDSLPGLLIPPLEKRGDPEKEPGHEKCEKLREIRRKIAKANDIFYEPAVCTHQGPCFGTCPACDREIRYLDQMLEEKRKRGEEICLFGIAKEDIACAMMDPFIEDDEMPTADGGLLEFDTLNIKSMVGMVEKEFSDDYLDDLPFN